VNWSDQTETTRMLSLGNKQCVLFIDTRPRTKREVC